VLSVSALKADLAYTASEAGLAAQLRAIRLAKEVGVKLFVTCEYTLEFSSVPTSPHVEGSTPSVADMTAETYPLVKLRREAVDIAKEVGLPTLQVHLGELGARISRAMEFSSRGGIAEEVGQGSCPRTSSSMSTGTRTLTRRLRTGGTSKTAR
jgi:hypothetical protein